MAMELVSIKCPGCGAALEVEDEGGQAVCPYCRTEFILYNENERVYRKIDEAKVKQTEVDKLIRLKEMEIEEKKRVEAEKAKALKLKVFLILLGIGIVLVLFGTLLIGWDYLPYSPGLFIQFGLVLTVVGVIGLFKQR